MTTLTRQQIEQFREEGYVVAQAGVTPRQLASLNEQLDAWIEESRLHAKNFGETIDGKARFDLEATHSQDAPRLRRINTPVEVSEAYRDVMMNARYVDMICDLIGPNVKFHHCKVNVKMPGSPHEVRWHQDHPFDPHTNDDELVTLLLLTDMTLENGPVEVVPGSHRERYSLYQSDVYTGEISAEEMETLRPRAVPVTGRAGDVCIIDTWMVHGSGVNRTERPRSLFISDYTAADAFPLTPPAVPSTLHGTIVRGKATRFARLRDAVLELPQPFSGDTFFSYQETTATLTAADGGRRSAG
jgi:ectoine hydroxylase-related dioxygenase (phytanoyl-CoA dioxygenase family)